ncbi:hypothetical protein MMC13_001862 [Lambiella insularis]|nr:hypothetical protein [Lambiella insularis]
MDREEMGREQSKQEKEESRNTPLRIASRTADIAGSIPASVLESTTRSSQLQPEQYIMTGNMLVDDELAQTPMSDACSSVSAVSMDSNAGKLCVGHDGDGASDFIPSSTLHAPSPAWIASWASTSNSSSPLNSACASSASLQSFEAGGSLVDEPTPATVDNVSSPSTLFYHQASEAPTTTSLPPIVTTHKQPATQLRRESPHYPNQSFAAVQSQYYPPHYQPHPLRTRSSHPSQNTSYTSAPSPQSRDRSSCVSGARTVGNTPAQSPGLFSPTTSSHKLASGMMEDSQYVTPLLHSTHLQAPKETHKLMKDIDPISGRKIVNNYEFQAKLGSGAHGTVKLGRNLQTDEYVAIKIVRRFSKKLRLGKQESPEDKVKKEVAILKKARHAHVVSLLEVIDDQEFGKVYLILEYVELGEIIWRTMADHGVAIFEKNRVLQEMAGNCDEHSESEAVAQFNQALPAKRIEKQRLSAIKEREDDERTLKESTSRAGRTQTAADHGANWSFEPGGEAVDELRGNADLVQRLHIGDERSKSTTSSRVGTPALEEAEDPLGLASGSVAHEDFSWDSHVSNESTAHHNVMDQMFTETHPLEDDEEYRYVPCLTLSQTLDAFRDTVLGLEYLHYQGIIHRDIKPANLLWTADHRVKISDFGVSYLGRPIREDDNKEEIEEADATNLDEAIELAKTVGTPAFYAPELCDPDLFDSEKHPERPQITGQIDVWALGVTLYGMIFGRLPFFDSNEFVMYEKIARQEVFIPSKRLRAVETNTSAPLSSQQREADLLAYEEVDDELRDLLRRLLHKQASKRITLKEVKHHPWVLRGIKDVNQWIDETDPSLQSQGKKIEVSTQEVNDAVAPLTIVDRIKSGIRRLGSVVRGRDARKRAESSAKSSEASTGDRQSRRTSLRGDEQIFSALRASRENAEHPLAQSLAASPELTEGPSYFPDPTTIVERMPSSSRASPIAQRPKPIERTISTAESVETIRAPVPKTIVRQSTPPILTEGVPTTVSAGDSAASSSSSLSGIFGGAGRRLVRGMRSRERAQDRDEVSQSSRSSSVENMASNFEDPHASPSIAFSPATASGHVDQPPVLRDAMIDSQPHRANLDSVRRPSESSSDAWQRAQEQNYRRHKQEHERTVTEIQPRSRANTTLQCPPSPDDFTQTRRESLPSQDASMAVSSSDDQMTSGISESFSHPSIPSVVSGASSLATTYEEQGSDTTSSLMSSGQTTIGSNQGKSGSGSSAALDDDEAGYNGDGDEEEEESDDDVIMFGKKK